MGRLRHESGPFSALSPQISRGSLSQPTLAQRGTTFVDNIDYDAKGLRERIEYGNGTFTAYTYDPLTFRLSRLKTTRSSDSVVLQNLTYVYDPVGNIVEIGDSAQQTVFFNNAVVSPSARYAYDAVYRLIEAMGREHAGGLSDAPRDQNDLPIQSLPHANDAQALRNYTEQYVYDAVGNLRRMVHQAGTGRWTRWYAYEETENNQLTSTTGDPENGPFRNYAHDAHGNMTLMPHITALTWDENDQLRSTDLGGGGVVYYTYSATGQRVRKVWEHNGLVDERIYLGGYEVYRRRSGSGLVLERQTLHVMDGARRVAMVETKTVDTSGPFTVTPRVRYQLDNHLGSASLEVDGAGLVIGYEEYHPYGTTAYWSASSAAEVSRKRYRYTGKEKDEETGLYYQGARYYAPWLGRWTSADPAGFADGPSLYAYVRGDPVRLVDPRGTNAEDPLRSDAPSGVVQFKHPSAGGQTALVSDAPIRFEEPGAPEPVKPEPAPVPVASRKPPHKANPPPLASTSSPVATTAPAATTAEAVGAFAKGAAEGLASGILVNAAIGVGAGLAGVSVGVAAATVGVVLLPFAIHGVISHWDEITASVDRLVHGAGTAKDYQAAGEVVGGLLSTATSGPASRVGAELGQAIRTEVTSAVSALGPKLAPVGASLDDVASSSMLQSTGGTATAKGGAASFTDDGERAIAEYLEAFGRKVRKNPQEGVPGAGRQGDAYVDGVMHEFKTLDPGAGPGTVKNVANDSIRGGGQAREIIMDARGTGLTKEAAEKGAARALGISRGKLDGLTMIGDGYFFRWTPR
ncbi:RHS repeat-associated core domain-containing protein [Sorangium sp. So ce124]|uniref:RHS repeat-associated core domain-containing protein n=1 Tax=Sorangium sp. So ce124 TaxID=3133280 RepID=UPI003F5FEFD7